MGDTEDWKAAVYCFGGPKPSEIEHVELQVVPESMTIEVMYWLNEKGKERWLTQNGGNPS